MPIPTSLALASATKVATLTNQPRSQSFGFCGGAFGDEGKGRIVDMVVADLVKQGPVVVYRDNGGANAGHTVEFPSGKRVALHQLPSGVFVAGATVALGKEMVIHPGDLLTELAEVESVAETSDRAEIKLDEMAILSLDTHRAYEGVLKQWQSGGKGATGRGISPAYADVLLRHPLRVRDIIQFNTEKIKQHYEMYAALIHGLGFELATHPVATLAGPTQMVGSVTDFMNRLEQQGQALSHYAADMTGWLEKQWRDPAVGFVFEKAQAIGLDYRWGVYPDITASDTTFDGIFSATEGLIDPDQITVKAGVIKATYMSSVGTRQLPTLMTTPLADRIREDAHEYGATTKRPRDIAYLDIPALRFFAKTGRLNALVLTHLDVSYPDEPIQICVGYQQNGQSINYRPDQEFLKTVTPVYETLPPWDGKALRTAKTKADLPAPAVAFIERITQLIGLPIIAATTGPQRDQTVWL